MMKKLFSKIHLWLSIPAGIFITIICLTGAALVFQNEITRALQSQLYTVSHAEGAKHLPPSQLAKSIQQQVADTLTIESMQLSANPDASCQVAFEQMERKTLFVNPYTGQVLGWGKDVSFFKTMRNLHRFLLNAPQKRGDMTVGKFIVNTATLLMIVILVSGIVIWLPRKGKSWKRRLTVSYKNGGQRFWHDTHVSLGIYAVVFLLLMALTGPTWGFKWYRTAAYGLFGANEERGMMGGSHHGKSEKNKGGEANFHEHGGKPGKENHGFNHGGSQNFHKNKDWQDGHGEGRPRGGDSKENLEADFNPHAWDVAYATLQARYPESKYMILSKEKIQVSPVSESGMRRFDNALFNAHTGTIEKVERFANQPRQMQMRSWFFALHTGSWGGIASKILYFVVVLLGASFPITGYYFWLTKRKKRSKSSQRN